MDSLRHQTPFDYTEEDVKAFVKSRSSFEGPISVYTAELVFQIFHEEFGRYDTSYYTLVAKSIVENWSSAFLPAITHFMSTENMDDSAKLILYVHFVRTGDLYHVKKFFDEHWLLIAIEESMCSEDTKVFEYLVSNYSACGDVIAYVLSYGMYIHVWILLKYLQTPYVSWCGYSIPLVTISVWANNPHAVSALLDCGAKAEDKIDNTKLYSWPLVINFEFSNDLLLSRMCGKTALECAVAIYAEACVKLLSQT